MSFGGMFDGAGSGVFSYDAGGGGGGGGGGGVHNSRLLPAPPVPKPGGGYAAPGLSLGLQTNMDGGHLGDMNRSLAMMGNGGSGSGGDGDSLGRGREDENDSRSGSDNLDGASGDDLDPDNSNPRKKKKRYHRHTPQQIQELEAVFKECPHPDEKQRMELSRRLNLESRQVKFWFQNRRTQMKDADRAARERAAAAGERQAEGGEHDDPRGDAEPHVRQLRRRGGARRGVAGGAAPAHRERTAEGRARPRLRARRQVPRPANLEHLLAQSAVAAGVLRPRARRRKQWVRARRPRGLGVAVHPRPDGWLRRPARGLCCHAPPRGHWRPRRRHARRGGRRRRHRPRRAPRARPRGHGRARQGCADGRAALAPQPRRRVRGAKLRRVPPRVRQGARPEPRQLRLRGHPRVRHRHHQQRRPRRQPHGRASLVGDVPVHRGEGEHDGHHLQRHGRHAQRVNSTDARGAAGAVAAGADPGGGLPPFLQAARRGPLGRRRRVGRRRPPPRPERRRRRRRFLLVVVHGLPPPPHRLHRAGHEQWLLQGHVGGSRGVRRDGGAPALPAAAPLRPGPRRPPLARLAPAPVPVPGHPLFQLPPRPRPRRDNAGGEEEHAEVGAADDGQLLRRGVRVGGAEVAAPGRVARRRGGRRRRRRGGQGAHDGAAQRGRARGAPRRRAERHHVGAPPRHAPAARVRLPPRRAAARRLGHPGQRRGHAGDGPHRQGPASRQCRLPPPSKCYEREPEQHADPPGDVHRFIGLPRRLRTGGRAIHARRHERRRLRLRLPPAVRLRHPPGRPQQRLAVPGRCRQRLAELHRGRRSHRRRQQQHRLAGDGGVPDPRQQSAHREAHRRVGRHRQQPPLLHHPEDQVRSAGQHHLAIDSGHLTWIPSRPVTKGSIRMPPQMSNLRG